MNRQLKRIEQTLHSLEKTATVAPAQTTAAVEPIASQSSTAQSRTVSFQLSPAPQSRSATPAVKPAPPTASPAITSSPATTVEPAPPVATFVTITSDSADVSEKFKLPTFTNQTNTNHPTLAASSFGSGNLGFSRHQNGSNPDLALNLLQETLTLLQSWRSELQTVIRRIQEIYREGPIVDGWLECSTQKVEATTEILRHAEVSHLMGYVEQICADPSSTQPEYRLCGLSADGRVWSSPCPQSQLASISLAISRHQKLQPLLQRQHVLENHLQQAAVITTKVHSQIQAL
jgi:hypothetical protein